MNAMVMRQAFEVFDRVREAPSNERDALLDSDDSLSDEVRSAVRDLLLHDSPTGEFLGMSLNHAAASLTRPLGDVTLPERIGRYRILKEIGRGGFGRVYLAEQESPKRMVAVKVLRVGFSGTDARRLVFEAEALARLDHPGIARVYESGTCDDGEGSPFIAMEYVEGMPLHRYVEDQEVPRTERVRILQQVAEALEHAHQRGVLHRDIAPKNIVVDNLGRPRLIDFGLAQGPNRRTSGETMTAAGSVLGTLRYLSPEQLGADRRSIDTRSDVFSLGVVAFELLTKAHPFMEDSDDVGGAIRHQLEASARLPRSIESSLRGDFEAVLLKCVEREPIRRYQSAAALAADLQALRTGAPVAARSYSALARLATLCSRHRVWVGAAAVVALIVAVSGTCMAIALHREASSRNAALNALDAVVNHVIAPLSPRVGTLDEREKLLEVIAPEIEFMLHRTPDDARVARIAGAYFGAVGDVAKERGDYPRAIAIFDRSLASYARARALGDESLATAHAASIVSVKQGNAYEYIPDGPHAQGAYKRALAIDLALASRFPEDLRALSNLFWSHWRLAASPYDEGFPHGDHAASASNVAEQMRSVAPDDWRTLEALARVLTRHGSVASVGKQYRLALGLFDEAAVVSRRLLDEDPTSRVFLKLYVQALCRAAEAAANIGETSLARSCLEEAQPSVQLLAKEDSEPYLRGSYTTLSAEVGAQLAYLDRDFEAAAEHCEERLRGLGENASIRGLAPDWAMSRLRMLRLLADASAQMGDSAQSMKAIEQLCSDASWYAETFPLGRADQTEASEHAAFAKAVCEGRANATEGNAFSMSTEPSGAARSR